MNVVELILELGRWGQTHQTEMLTGLLAPPVLLGVASLVLRGRQRGHHDARLGAVGDPAGSAAGGALWTPGRGAGAARRTAAR